MVEITTFIEENCKINLSDFMEETETQTAGNIKIAIDWRKNDKGEIKNICWCVW